MPRWRKPTAKPGAGSSAGRCCDCCLGAFEISGLDAERLRRGLTELETRDPARATRIRTRAGEAAARLRRKYPATPRIAC